MAVQKMTGFFFVALLLINMTMAGPFTVAACYSVCGTGWAACYAAAGAVAGTVTAGVGVPAAILACNAAMAGCYAGCTGFIIAPTP